MTEFPYRPDPPALRPAKTEDSQPSLNPENRSYSLVDQLFYGLTPDDLEEMERRGIPVLL